MHGMFFLTIFLFKFSTTKQLSCFERDYCNGTITNDRSMNNSELIKERNCFCDNVCFQYDDCCEDIKHYQLKKSIQATCVDYTYPFRIRSQLYISTVMPIWMVTTCLINYKYTQLEKNCRNAIKEDYFLSNPPAYIPMTNRRTNITYRNIFCAQCNNEKIEELINWSFQIVCNGLKQNYIFNYTEGLNIIKLPPQEAEQCINRLSFPSSPAIVYPCKQHTINSCPNSFHNNQTIINRCLTVNAYRYVTHSHPIHMRVHSLYRNEYCLICHNVTNSFRYLETSCEHQLDDELIIDPKPKTGRHGIYRLSIIFDPNTFSIQMPTLSLSDYQYHSSYQTHFTTSYPCRYFEVYDYLLQTCIILRNEDDWKLTRNYNCTNPILLIRNQMKTTNSIEFLSHKLYQKHGDFIRLFSDRKKIILCGERFSLIYIHHNRFLTTIRYSSTIISLLSLLIFIISFTQKSTLHNLPGKCLLMLAISLHLSQLMFLASGHLLEYSDHFWCICSGIGVQFFYLSTFAWLSAISFDTCLALTRMNRLDARIARIRFIQYNIFVWIFSFVIVLISVCLHLFLSENNPWSPNYGRILCSISSKYALITFFLFPIGLLVLINLIIFLRTIYVVHRIDKETKLARCIGKNERSRGFLYFRLTFLMGIHWLFLLICIIFKQDILWILFDIINSLPGLFIAISFLRKHTSLADIKTRIRSSQSQLSSLCVPSNTITTTNNQRCTTGDVSPNIQMSRKLDDITERLDKITQHILRPNDLLSSSSSSFHRSAGSL